jgi:hypothetical protein
MANLEKLNLEDNGLGGYVPDELFNLTSLTHLNLAHQYENPRNCTLGSDSVALSLEDRSYGLEGMIFEKIYRLRHLKKILAENNYFSGTISPEIKNLKQLGEHIVAAVILDKL